MATRPSPSKFPADTTHSDVSNGEMRTIGRHLGPRGVPYPHVQAIGGRGKQIRAAVWIVREPVNAGTCHRTIAPRRIIIGVSVYTAAFGDVSLPEGSHYDAGRVVRIGSCAFNLPWRMPKMIPWSIAADRFEKRPSIQQTTKLRRTMRARALQEFRLSTVR